MLNLMNVEELDAKISKAKSLEVQISDAIDRGETEYVDRVSLEYEKELSNVLEFSSISPSLILKKCEFMKELLSLDYHENSLALTFFDVIISDVTAMSRERAES